MIEGLVDFGGEVFVIADLDLVEPAFDVAAFFECGLDFADDGLVGAGVREERSSAARFDSIADAGY